MPDDAVSAVAELAASQHRAFTRRQAAQLNFDRARVATAKRLGWLTEPYPGVLVIVGSDDCWRQRLVAATLAAGGRRRVAPQRGPTPRLDGFESCDILELSVTRGHRWWFVGPVISHHVAAIDPADVVTIDGVPCTGLARNLCDLGAVIPPLLCLDDPGIPPIELQYPIRDATGRVVARADIGIPSARPRGAQPPLPLRPRRRAARRPARHRCCDLRMGPAVPRVVRDEAPGGGRRRRQTACRHPPARTVTAARPHRRVAITVRRFQGPGGRFRSRAAARPLCSGPRRQGGRAG
jgi:putative AbiEi antitoxin of type IV toxin-antitoxin system